MKIQESEDTQQNVEEINNSKLNGKEEMIKRIEVEDTPFTIIQTEDKTFGSMGVFRLTEYRETRVVDIEELKDELKEITWNRLVQVIMLLTEQLKTEDLKKD